MNFRSRRSRMLLAFVVATVVFVAGLQLLRARFNGPSHGGRALSEWIMIYSTASGSFAATSEAAGAIRTIGTNGIPSLLKWLAFEPISWQLALGTRLEQLPPWVHESAPLRRYYYRVHERAGCAMIAFGALGPAGAPAVPELHRIVCRTNGTASSNRALFALASIGSEAMPAITNILATTPLAGDPFMLMCLKRMGTNAAAAAPVILSNLRHPDSRLAAMSANFLGVLQFDPNSAVPALGLGLSDPDVAVRAESARALGAYGNVARPTLPALTNLLGDKEPIVRELVVSAIKSITSDIQE